LLGIAVLVASWLAVCCIYFFIEFRKPSDNKLVLSKELSRVYRFWVVVIIRTLPLIFQEELWEISVTSLEQKPALGPSRDRKAGNVTRGLVGY
jgi:undecaprenyl pyrophosphate phosphatase UppP